MRAFILALLIFASFLAWRRQLMEAKLLFAGAVTIAAVDAFEQSYYALPPVARGGAPGAPLTEASKKKNAAGSAPEARAAGNAATLWAQYVRVLHGWGSEVYAASEAKEVKETPAALIAWRMTELAIAECTAELSKAQCGEWRPEVAKLYARYRPELGANTTEDARALFAQHVLEQIFRIPAEKECSLARVGQLAYHLGMYSAVAPEVRDQLPIAARDTLEVLELNSADAVVTKFARVSADAGAAAALTKVLEQLPKSQSTARHVLAL